MRLSPFLLCAFLALAGPVMADQVDDAVRAEMKRIHIPGVSVLVLKDGKVIKEKGYGLANVEHNVPVTPQTVFQSGSVGKTFTAALVLLLAEDGKLSIDDPVSRHLANTPKVWESITIRHLLTHTSGLADPYEELDFRKDYTDEELIAVEAGIPMLFAPGEAYSYSNMGYHLLGFICNKVGGKFYGDQLRERIFAPLGMSTRIISESDIVPHRAAGYEWSKRKLVNQSWVSPGLNTTADGSLYLTAKDLAIWDAAMQTDKILNAKMRAASFTPATLKNGSKIGYGYGWQLASVNGHPSIGHGGWQGFKSQMTRYVDDKLTVIVLANSAAASYDRLTNAVARQYVPALATLKPKAIADSEPAVTAQVRELLSQLMRGAITPGQLSDKAAAVFTQAHVKAMAERLADQGALKQIELLERSVEGETRNYRYRFIMADEILVSTVKFDKANRVDQFTLRPE